MGFYPRAAHGASMEFSGIAVSGRERVRIETVIHRSLSVFRCATCGARAGHINLDGQCLPCEMKFARVDRAVLR